MYADREESSVAAIKRRDDKLTWSHDMFDKPEGSERKNESFRRAPPRRDPLPQKRQRPRYEAQHPTRMRDRRGPYVPPARRHRGQRDGNEENEYRRRQNRYGDHEDDRDRSTMTRRKPRRRMSRSRSRSPLSSESESSSSESSSGSNRRPPRRR